MPWYLPNGACSKLSVMSLSARGAEHIWDRGRSDYYRSPETGLQDKDAFYSDLYAHQILKFKRRRKAPLHGFYWDRGNFLSETAKRILDRLAPGVYDPLAVHLEQSDGSTWPEPFWYFPDYKLPAVNAIDIEVSKVKTKEPDPYRGDIFDSPILWTDLARAPKDTQTFLDARDVEGFHFFREARAYYKFFFFSDEFVEALEEIGALSAFDLEYVGLTHSKSSKEILC